MTAVAVNSQLNPLANAFVPTNSKLLVSKKAIQYSVTSENEAKTTGERKGKPNSNEPKSEYEIPVMTETYCQKVLWKDIIFFGSITSVLNVFLKNSSIMDQTGLHALEGSQLPMLPECLADDDQKLVQKSEVDATSPRTLEKKDECNCPAMFGWIMPPDFIGNPFNFKYECSKKYPHSPSCTIKQSVDTLDLDTKINQWTLDQCVLEMKDILEDVYETISFDHDPITKWEEKYKIQDYLEVSDSDGSDEDGNELNGFDAEFTSRVSIKILWYVICLAC